MPISMITVCPESWAWHMADTCSKCRNLLYGSWDYEKFRRLHLKEYMVMCEGFGAEFTSKDMYASQHKAPVCPIPALLLAYHSF